MNRGDMPPLYPPWVTQQQIASLSDIHVRTLRRYIKGQYPPPDLLAILLRLMAHFELSPDQVREIVWGKPKKRTILR